MSRADMKKKRQEKISHVLKHAKKAFATYGYATASTNEIAQKAGISKRSMYYYVGIKEDIYRSVIDGIVSGIKNSLKNAMAHRDHLSPKEKLYELISAIAKITKDDDAYSILSREMISGGQFLPKKAVGELADYINELFSDILAQGQKMSFFIDVDPLVFGVMIQSFFLHWKILARQWDIDSADTKKMSKYGENITDALVDEVYRIVKLLAKPQSQGRRNTSNRILFAAAGKLIALPGGI